MCVVELFCCEGVSDGEREGRRLSGHPRQPAALSKLDDLLADVFLKAVWSAWAVFVTVTCVSYTFPVKSPPDLGHAPPYLVTFGVFFSPAEG